MGGILVFASKSDCVMDHFFGIDYHSHLGTRRAEWPFIAGAVDLTV